MLVLTTLINGCRETQELTDGTWFIGRGGMCRVRLDFPDVSERHAILTVRGGRAVIEDLHSANGTYVNGEEIDSAVALDGTKVVQIGNSMLRVSEAEEAQPAETAPDPAPSAAEPPPPADEDAEEAAKAADPLRELRRNVQEQIQKELLKRMDMKRLTMQGVDREGLEDTAREKIRQIIEIGRAHV